MHHFKPFLFLQLLSLTRVCYHTISHKPVKCMGNLGSFCCLFKPLLFFYFFLLVFFVTVGMLCDSEHQETFDKKKTQTKQTLKKRQHILPVLQYFTAPSVFPVNKIDWIGALCFPSPFSPYNSPVMSHVTVALPWVSLNLRAQWLHQRAIPQRSPGINLALEQSVMNLDCLNSSRADSFHDQPSQLVVRFVPERDDGGDGKRGHPSGPSPRLVFTNSALTSLFNWSMQNNEWENLLSWG